MVYSHVLLNNFCTLHSKFSIIILRKNPQNQNIFTQFEFILARPNSKTSMLSKNLIEAFSSYFK